MSKEGRILARGSICLTSIAHLFFLPLQYPATYAPKTNIPRLLFYLSAF
jgi:hypothetical protein